MSDYTRHLILIVVLMLIVAVLSGLARKSPNLQWAIGWFGGITVGYLIATYLG